MAETLRLRAGTPNSWESRTAELRFVDRAGRYILQQLIRIKYPNAMRNPSQTQWRDVPLHKEPS